MIENNDARLLYLATYGRVDSIDHLISNLGIKYRSWKYWHAAANHFKALGILVAYDVYMELAEGKLDPTLKIDKPVTLHVFQDVLSKQQCEYDPRHQKYPGDENMRIVTKINKMARGVASGKTKKHNLSTNGGRVSKESYEIMKQVGRFCYTVEEYHDHLNALEKAGKSRISCAVCKLPTYQKCGKCKVALHGFHKKGDYVGFNCHYQWHSPKFFGLCYKDKMFENTGKRAGKLTNKGQWMWSKTAEKQNAKMIEAYENEEE